MFSCRRLLLFFAGGAKIIRAFWVGFLDCGLMAFVLGQLCLLHAQQLQKGGVSKSVTLLRNAFNSAFWWCAVVVILTKTRIPRLSGWNCRAHHGRLTLKCTNSNLQYITLHYMHTQTSMHTMSAVLVRTAHVLMSKICSA